VIVEGVTPILNVSDLEASFSWFEKLGWKRGFVWGDPPGFGSVCNARCEIFLCKDGQGARGGPMPQHVRDDDTGATWMTWWVKTPAEVDAAHEHAVAHGLTVTRPPTNEPWGVRECHLRHPDGHTFRISCGLNAA
jgi:catechol 2,3-dioxygenase-like lactoylglutathione lyase family enzyme